MPISPKYGQLIQFDEAISHFKQKIQIPTESYKDLRGHIHARAFTVAGATNTELLGDLHKAVTHAIEDGETLAAFRKRFDDIVAKHGWSYNGKRGWRTKTIYRNNKNTARAAGRWEQQQRVKARRPYLLYLTAGDQRVRPQHGKWNYILLPIEHNFWHTHYPPNGWLCRCKVVNLSEAEIKRQGLTVTPENTLKEHTKYFTEVDANTGEELQRLPGIDLGWDYNPGKAWLGGDISVGKILYKQDKHIREMLIPKFNDAVNAGESQFKKHIATTAAKQALGRQLDDGAKLIVGHLNNNAVDKVIAKSALDHSTLVVIDDAMISVSLAAIGFEQTANLMQLIQQASSAAYNQSVLKLTTDSALITIQVMADFNRVVAVEKL
ncbi:phage head morphogenesis protein [Pseudoalteromonas sp. MMG013]|uniref:phage head morphogenesis protein n=1 Tax=Pseudoalteromonas sp. MMG013 TaxID=2822687 RepID=UPI001B37328B|nr:phage minor head protein [Pseudoalteromonas sp. MMG013]MBQ4864420.1 phage head morphogenesis protein [Pseudoalteromonas sp. MMG013]